MDKTLNTRNTFCIAQKYLNNTGGNTKIARIKI